MRNSSKGSNSGLLILIILLLIAILLAVSNPKIAKHEKAIQQAMQNANPVASLFGASTLASSVVEYEDYLVFSTTRYQHKTITLGVGSQVWIQDQNGLTNASD